MNHLVCKNILCFSEFTLLLWEIVPGKYGEDLEQMGFNDESETDYLDSVKLCTDLVWRHGTVRHFNTALLVSHIIPFVILFILVYGRFMMIIQVNSVQWTRVLCMAAAWLCRP